MAWYLDQQVAVHTTESLCTFWEILGLTQQDLNENEGEQVCVCVCSNVVKTAMEQ